MRTPLVATAAALLGFIVGWASHTVRPKETIRYIAQSEKAPAVVAKAEPAFPEMPKPPLDEPEPTSSVLSTGLESSPPPLRGDLPHLPSASTELAPVGPLTPAKTPSSADLNADEARVRQVFLKTGAEVVSSSDAQDSGGKAGRFLTAEITPSGLPGLRSALREALGRRVVISDGGAVAGSSTEVRKAEDEVTLLRRQLEKAQNDFLPNAPALRNVEDAYREGERNLAQVRKNYARQRVNILIRSDVGE